VSDVWLRVLTSVLFLGGCAAVFVFGSSYYQLFRTNRSFLYKGALVVGFAAATWLTMRSTLAAAYGLLAFAFLAAATASLLGAAAAHLQKPLGIRDDTLRGMAYAKGIEAVVVVGAIVVLAVVVRVPLRSLYMQAGRLGLGLAIGLGGFLVFAALAAAQARTMKIPWATIRRQVPWILLFVLANGFMEELWLRAVFLGPLAMLVGPIVAIALTALVFALAHVGVSYMSKEERVRFLVILFPLGLAWGACLHVTGSILASSVFHAGADLMIVNGLISSAMEGSSDAASS